MPNPSTHLKLLVPGRTDQFSTGDIASNWGAIDASPGVFICTSTTRPTDWGADQAGMEISETDTNLKWRWNGVTWLRSNPRGVLRRNDGTPAVGTTLNSFATTSTTPKIVVSVTNVVVPAGMRPLMIYVNYLRSQAGPTGSWFRGYVFRSAPGGLPAANSGTEEFEFACPDNGAGAQNGINVNGLAAGTYSWSFQVAMTGSTGANAVTTATVDSGTSTPISITVVEL